MPNPIIKIKPENSDKASSRSEAPNKREKPVFRKCSTEAMRQPRTRGETPLLPLDGTPRRRVHWAESRRTQPQAAGPQAPVTQGRGFPTGPSFPQTCNQGLDMRTLSNGPSSIYPFLLSAPPTEPDPGQSKIRGCRPLPGFLA